LCGTKGRRIRKSSLRERKKRDGDRIKGKSGVKKEISVKLCNLVKIDR